MKHPISEVTTQTHPRLMDVLKLCEICLVTSRTEPREQIGLFYCKRALFDYRLCAECKARHEKNHPDCRETAA